MGIKINVTDQNNVSVAVIPQARQVVSVNTPPNQTISINRGLIGPQGTSGYSGYSGFSGQSGISGFSGQNGICLLYTSDAADE